MTDNKFYSFHSLYQSTQSKYSNIKRQGTAPHAGGQQKRKLVMCLPQVQPELSPRQSATVFLKQVRLVCGAYSEPATTKRLLKNLSGNRQLKIEVTTVKEHAKRKLATQVN